MSEVQIDGPRDLAGQRVLVTGGSSGLGAGIVRLLASRGADVAIGYHDGRERADELAAEARECGARTVAIGGDMSDPHDVDRAFDAAAAELDGLTGCVINAGLQADAAFEAMSIEDWRRPIALDLDGAFLCAQALTRRLPKRVPEGSRARGGLVFVTSVHAWIPWAGHINYAAAKAGADMLMRSIAQETAHTGLRVNAVAPGAIRTPINRDVWEDEDRRAKLMDLIPYGRLGESADVAEAVAWLLSDRSDYVVGTTITVDGGMSLSPGFIGNG